MSQNETIGCDQGDLVLVRARPKPYKAIVMHIDRAWSGDPVKLKVRPIDAAISARARNVRAKHILEVIPRGQWLARASEHHHDR